MKSLIPAIGIAALGGGITVFGAYDDAPGASIFGILLVLGAIAFVVRTARRRQ